MITEKIKILPNKIKIFNYCPENNQVIINKFDKCFTCKYYQLIVKDEEKYFKCSFLKESIKNLKL